MGLFLPYEKMWDMPLGGNSTEKQVPHWFGNIAGAIVYAVFKVLFRIRVEHRERLRAFKGKSGVLLIANHTSFMDVVIIFLTTRFTQWARFMARDSLFDNGHGLLGQIISRAGAFPIKRDSADRTAVKRATRMLKDGEIVLILPEGTRRGKSSREPELHSGASFIARMAHVPILPMTVRNAELVKQKGKFIRFPKITVDYGEPVLVGDFDFLPKEERLDACTWYAMRECFALSQSIDPEDVDMASLFPNHKDYTAIFAEHPVPSHTVPEVLEGT